jgi:hypothetical protein
MRHFVVASNDAEQSQRQKTDWGKKWVQLKDSTSTERPRVIIT